MRCVSKRDLWFVGLPIRMLNKIFSYCLAPQIFVLLIIVFVLWGYAAYRGRPQVDAMKIGFESLFMPDRAKDFGGMAIYLVVWLIGGGVLVSSILSTASRFRAGFWRKWPWTVGGHVVILGWDGNVPTRIQEYLKRKNARKRIPESFYVLTTADVAKVRRALEPIFKWYLPIRYYVYQGSYTDPAELRKLRIYRAHEVFVVGEETDAAHDSTVRMIPCLIGEACKADSKSKWGAICNLDRSWSCLFELKMAVSNLFCHVTISGFGLFHMLNDAHEDPVGIGDRNMIVRYENFHNNWARKLLTGDAPQIKLQDRLIIIGFGAMGKAFAVVAHEVAPKLEIVVVGDRDADKDPGKGHSKLTYELARFEAQFRWVETKVPGWGLSTFATLDPSSFCCDKYLENAGKTTIAICIKRSEKGLLWAMEIASWLSQNRAQGKVELLLCQEIGGNASDRIGDAIKLGQFEVKLFGMKDGAGFGEKFGADEYRNLDTGKLQAYAAEAGAALARDCGIDGARWVLGGSLAYDAALAGCYDIDLRLLLPDGPDVRDRIDETRDLLVRRAAGDPTFRTKFIDEGGKNYIWHTKQMVKIPGLSGDPDVELSWNIQSAGAYGGIAETAKLLPQEILDRYVVAKWYGREAGKAAYMAVKESWKSFLQWVSKEKSDWGRVGGAGLETWLSGHRDDSRFPDFLSGIQT